jgi:DNA-binding NtrC family response regulator
MESSTDRPRLLFVDDEESIRVTLPPLLEKHGFEVSVAASVAEALAEINETDFDILLSDLNIEKPGDGFLVISATRHIRPRCLNFILTGFPAFETAVQALRSQVDDYFVKPSDTEDLISRMKEKLENRAQVSRPCD